MGSTSEDQETDALTPEHLHFWRLTDSGYVAVSRKPNGRFHSEQLGLEIGVDEAGELCLYTPGGEPLLNYEEEQRAREEAERARAVAEERARTEAAGRAAAERRAIEAEARAAKERAQREALERQLAELQARLQRDDA